MNLLQQIGLWGLYLLAVSSLLATAPAHLGAALALPAALAGLAARQGGPWDWVARLSLAVALWLLLRYGLQMAGFGEPGLIKPGAVLVDWLFPLLFLPFALIEPEDRLRLVARLWLLALLGCTLGVLAFLVKRGPAVLWSGERLGFHLARAPGIGLYAGTFLLLLLGTWRTWWQATGPWRWPLRILGVALFALYAQVLITAQNRSNYLALLAALAVLGAGSLLAWRHGSSPLRRARTVATIVLTGCVLAGLAFVNRGVIEHRLSVEREVVTTIDSRGLDAAPASSISVRLRLWRFALESFPEAPLIGHGFGSLVDVINARVGATEAMLPGERYDHLHNSYLQLLWSQGLVGMALWGALLAALLLDVVRAARRDGRIRALLPTLGGVAAFIAVLICFDYRLSHVDTRMFVLLMLLSLRHLALAGQPHRKSNLPGEQT